MCEERPSEGGATASSPVVSVGDCLVAWIPGQDAAAALGLHFIVALHVTRSARPRTLPGARQARRFYWTAVAEAGDPPGMVRVALPSAWAVKPTCSPIGRMWRPWWCP